jgi:iron(III) transport system substrate-binding protein
MAAELVVYSSRNEQLIKPIFEQFTAETGIKVNYRTDKAGALIQRIKAEGRRTQADLLLTVDAGNLWQAANLDLLQPIDAKVLEDKVPAAYRGKDNLWFGLSVRARAIVYNPQKVDPTELSTYEALAQPEWKGKVLLRTSKKVYNQSLVAMLIATFGEEKTEEIVKGWVANLAQPVFSSDTKLLEALGSGQGSVGIVNTYYYGRLLKRQPDLPLKLFWPDQKTDGVHVNVSGAGITKHARNLEEATKLVAWMLSESGQRLLADLNMEYPVVPDIKPDPFVASWGAFKASEMNLTKAGELQRQAIMLMDRVGYN